MAAVEEPVAIDGEKLEQFVFRAVDEVGATLNSALVVMGDKLGLYKALAGAGPLTPVELARRTGVAERYVREWLNGQAAGGYVEYDGATGTYTLPPEQAVALADESSPAFLPGFFQVALGSVIDSPRVTEAARNVETARKRAEEAGVADRVTFEASPASTYSGRDYDLVTTFDALHDMGDPVGAARHVRETLADDGTWMIVEPMAGDRIEDNLNPVGRAYYGFSTFLCTPGSLSQEVGLALGAQAGPARIKDVVSAGGFSRFGIAAQTPFNLVYEARP